MHRISSRTDIPKILKQLLNLHQDIKMKSEILVRLREMSQTINGISLSHTYSKNKRSPRSKVEDSVIKIFSVEENFQKDITALSRLSGKFLAVLNKIEDIRCKELLTYRYLCGDTWEQVADKMNYSYVHIVTRLHPKALKLFDEFNL